MRVSVSFSIITKETKINVYMYMKGCSMGASSSGEDCHPLGGLSSWFYSIK